MNQNDFLNLLPTLSLGASIAACFYFSRPLLSALAERLRSSTKNMSQDTTELINRLNALEKFRQSAEGNHFHDLENTMRGLEEIRRDLAAFKIEVERRLTKIETTLNGSLKR